jgi:hypothetical protein
MRAVRLPAPVAGALLALALPALPSAAGAQRAADLPAGARVRLETRGPVPPPEATLVRVAADTLWLRYAGMADTVGVAFVHVRRLERSVGRRSASGQGALTGALVGGALGAVFGAVSTSGNNESCAVSCPSRSTAATTLGAMGAGLGLLVGVAVGAAAREAWERVPLR